MDTHARISYILAASLMSLIAVLFQTPSLAAAISATEPSPVRELPLPTVPASLTKPADRADFIIAHFWDAVDFSNPSDSLDDVSLEQNFVNYINLFSHAHSGNLPTEVKFLLQRAEASPATARRLYDLSDKYLSTKDSPFRNEEFHILFLENAVNSKALGEADRERAKFLLEAELKNRVGTPASDFKFETREGDSMSLSSFETTRPILLIFYDPDCGHCSETIEQLKSLNLDSFSIVAIDPMDDKDLWLKTKENLPRNWTVGYSLDPILDNETYVFDEMPSLYLLDKDKTILLKDTTLDRLQSQIRK